VKEPDVVIIGGGLSGLSAAIHLATAGREVQLYEKEKYPHHKVCGEYLSREILPYLNGLGITFGSIKPVEINTLVYSSSSGEIITTNLPLGGVGISRYALDNLLYKKALERGVNVIHESVTSVEFEKDKFLISSPQSEVTAGIVIGAFGKRSILDKKLDRKFIKNKTGWLAVKGHYKMDEYPENTVSLHNFIGGYCGLSKTETGAVNVCYLTTYKSFKKYKNSEEYKINVLSQNPHLHNFFQNATSIFQEELSIAQISFEGKSLVHDHVLMVGDAAGLIHPLCGNGMAMAIHSAKMASESILKYASHKTIERIKLEEEYRKNWNKNFRTRLRTGRVLQKILFNPRLSKIPHSSLNVFPFLLPEIIKRTHGKQVL